MQDVSIPAALRSAIEALRSLGNEPVLVGRFALVLLGSSEVTRDFDFTVSAAKAEDKAEVARALYRAGFRVVTGTDPVTGDVTEYLDDGAEAASHLMRSDPNVAFFWHTDDSIRVDVLFDFPISRQELAQHAEKVAITEIDFGILRAAPEDLRRMKSIAYNYRRQPRDLADIEFLDKLLMSRAATS